MTPAFVQKAGQVAARNSGGLTSLALTSLAGNTTAGNTLFVIVTTDVASPTVTVADNSSQAGAANTYTQDINVTQGSGANKVTTWVFRCSSTRSVLTTDTITATLGGSPVLASMLVLEASGILALSPLDVTATNSGTSGALDSGTTGATTSATEFVLAAYGIRHNGLPAPTYADATSGFTAVPGATTNTSFQQNRLAAASWRVTSSMAAQNDAPTLTGGTTQGWAAAILTYDPVVTGVSVSVPPADANAGSAGVGEHMLVPPTNALATAGAAAPTVTLGGVAVVAASATAGAAAPGWSEALPPGAAGLATAGAAVPGFSGGSTFNVAAPSASASASAPVLVDSMLVPITNALATTGAAAPVFTIMLGAVVPAGLATANAGVHAPLMGVSVTAGRATAASIVSLDPTPPYVPPIVSTSYPTDGTGGGGYGAVMSDAFTNRYSSSYKPTLKKQKVGR